MSALGMVYDSGICHPCSVELEGLNGVSVSWVLLNLVEKPSYLLIQCNLIQQTFVCCFLHAGHLY